jgi:hypothetical protein
LFVAKISRECLGLIWLITDAVIFFLSMVFWAVFPVYIMIILWYCNASAVDTLWKIHRQYSLFLPAVASVVRGTVLDSSPHGG